MSKLNEHSLTTLANAEFEQAARNVTHRAIQTNTRLILWEDNRVKNVDPQTFVRWKESMRLVIAASV